MQEKIEWEPPILHEDNHSIVVVKPPGMPVQADSSGDPDLLELTRAAVARRHCKPGRAFLGLVHRLDRPVGGLVLFARTTKGASRLSAQLRQRTIHKEYLALVQGRILAQTSEELEHWISHPQSSARIGKTADARVARLRYRCLEQRDSCSLLAIELITGRKHQIRAQLAHIGHPILGDLRYGAAQPLSDRSIALRSWKIDYQHPTRDERIQVELPQEHWPQWPSGTRPRQRSIPASN